MPKQSPRMNFQRYNEPNQNIQNRNFKLKSLQQNTLSFQNHQLTPKNKIYKT